MKKFSAEYFEKKYRILFNKLFVKRGFSDTVKELRKKLNIPKASFTRYILNLEKKKLIQREGEGKNKILKIK